MQVRPLSVYGGLNAREQQLQATHLFPELKAPAAGPPRQTPRPSLCCRCGCSPTGRLMIGFVAPGIREPAC